MPLSLRGMAMVQRLMDSVLVSRSKVASFAGLTFDGKRDLYAALGYKRVLVFRDYNDRYIRGGIAAKVVDAPASATWRNSPAVIEKGSEGKPSEFNDAWKELADRLSIFHYLERVDRISGIGQYGALLIGARGDLKTPLPHVDGPEDILFLSTFTEVNAPINKLTTDTSSPNFGLPETYNLNLSSEVASNQTLSTRPVETHHTRVIHVAEGLTENEIFGVPRMSRIWNYLDDLDKVVGGSSEAIWRVIDRGIQFNLDKDATLDKDDEEDFANEIEDFMHGFQRYIRTQGVEAKVLGSDAPNPQGAASIVFSLISGTTGIPQRVLFGSERGQLASTQDERNFNGRMKERQVFHAEPNILRPVVNTLISIGALPEPKDGYEVEWPDLSTLTEREQSDVAARFAQAIRNVATQGAQNAPTHIISADEFRQKFLGLGPMDESENSIPGADDGRTDDPIGDGDADGEGGNLSGDSVNAPRESGANGDARNH